MDTVKRTNALPSKLMTSPRIRLAVKLGLDLVLAIGAWEFTNLFITSTPLWWDGLTWGLLATFISYAFGLPRQHYRFIGFRDLIQIIAAGSCLLVIGLLIHFSLTSIQNSQVLTWVFAPLTMLASWAGVRALVRSLRELREKPRDRPKGVLRTLIVGAGRAGLLVAEELRQHPELGLPVGFVDDDIEKQGLSLHGLRVLGTQEMLPLLVARECIERVVLAIPSASGAEIRRLSERLQDLQIPFKTVPGIYSLLGDHDWRPELRDVSIEDLLRRAPIKLDLLELKQAIEDCVVLITGAGGSIGSELARQMCRFRPAKIVLLGRGEGSLWTIERELRGSYPEQSLVVELCDIRNRRRLAQVFASQNPSIVVHAAAHKHVPYLELNPDEAVENNIFGTRNVLEAAQANRVRWFINISTDKAVHPTNVLGVTKRVTEYLVHEAASEALEDTRYVSVRFGNVLGSRGSVVPIFQDQIRKGGPVTLTHPGMTRYFMTISEAAQLVLQAGLLGEGGCTYALDMGEPVRIDALARDMIRLSGLTPDVDIEIRHTGIRPGEKLFEEIFYEGTGCPSTVHPKVFKARTECSARQPLHDCLARLERALATPGPERFNLFLATFMDLVPTYTPAEQGLSQLADLMAENRR